MSAPRIVVTSPWKLGLFVFLLVTACGFGLIYLYFGYFGGRLDMNDPQAVRDFYMVCGSVAFLGLLGYLAIVSAAQPADRVAHYSRRRRKLLKKAAGITDPDRVDLEDYQHEPALAAVLERWREDRRRRQEAEAQVFSPQMQERLREVTRQLEEVRDETNRLAIHAALQLSRLGDEAAPLLQTMEELQEISAHQGRMVVELTAVGGSPAAEAPQAEKDSPPQSSADETVEALNQAREDVKAESPSPPETMVQEEAPSMTAPQSGGVGEAPQPHPASEPPSPVNPALSWGDLEPAAPMAPSPATTPVADASMPPQPEKAEVSVEDELAAVHQELFQRSAPAPVADPVDTRQDEQVHDLSEFGAVVLDSGDPSGGPQERVYDLKEFGAVEL